jgi:hypothetical protein
MDFIAGSVILAGAVTAWAAITHAQLDSVAYSDRRFQARNAATRALEEARAEGAEPLAAAQDGAHGPRDSQGFSLLRTFAVLGLRPMGTEPVGRLEVRALPVDTDAEQSGRRVFEVRAVIRWKLLKGAGELEMSTAIASSKP